MSDSVQPMDCSPPGSSVPGILQARILEWAAMPFSRGSFWPRNRTWVSCTAGRLFTIWGYSNTKRNKNIFKSLKMRIIWQMFLSIDPPQIVVWRQFLKFSVDLLKENWIDVQSVFTQNKTGIAFSKDYTNYRNLSSHASLPREYLTFLLDHMLCSLLWDRT